MQMTPERLESIRFQAAYCAHFKEREGKDMDFAELLDQRDDLLAHIDAIRKAVSMRRCVDVVKFANLPSTAHHDPPAAPMTEERLALIKRLNSKKTFGHMDSAVQHADELIREVERLHSEAARTKLIARKLDAHHNAMNHPDPAKVWGSICKICKAVESQPPDAGAERPE